MKVYDDSNYRELIGDGTEIIVGGERRLLSAVPKPMGFDARKVAKPFGSRFKTISRSEWPDRIAEQKRRKMRVSDHQRFKSTDQGSLPTCWAAGTCHAFMTSRVMKGLVNIPISPCSIAVPISGGRSGGYEGDAVDYFLKYGGVPESMWGPTDTRNYSSKPEIIEARKKFKAIEAMELSGFDEFATAMLLGYPCTVSYNWWSHVIMLADLVMIESNSFGVNGRNNWGESFGDKNDYGYGGYLILREGKGTPSGGYAFVDVESSAA